MNRGFMSHLLLPRALTIVLSLSFFFFSLSSIDVEQQYSGARIEGDTITLDFVKKMMDDFKNQKSLHKRYVFNLQ